MKPSFIDELSKARAVLEEMQQPAYVLKFMGLASTCVLRLQHGGKIMIAGNGGSAADAQHWAAELVARFNYDRPSIPAIALTTDTSALTAIGNDYGFRYVFSRQVEGIGRKGDVLIVISTSGNSENILEAITVAQAMGIHVIGFTGKDGGQMVKQCDQCFVVPSDETPHIQEAHTVIGHVLCSYIESTLHPK